VGLFRGLDFIFFPLVSCAHCVKPANLSASASILKPVSLMHYSVKNELLEKKAEVCAKKKKGGGGGKQKRIESFRYLTFGH